MFMLVERPPLLSEAALHGLRASLNAPIVNIDELPAGPARGAVVLHAEDFGRLQLCVVLRSLETSRSIVFSYQPDIDATAPARAIDAALSFGEEMGFLFDDDLVASGSAGRAEGIRIWEELSGQAAPGTPSCFQRSLPVEDIDAGGEIILEDLVEDLASQPPDPQPRRSPAGSSAEKPGRKKPLQQGALRPTVPAPRPKVSQRAEAPRPKPPQAKLQRAQSGDSRSGAGTGAGSAKLTKFRGAPKTEPTPDPGATSSQLGRIPIVKKRLAGEPKPSLLCRLLASF